MEEIQRESMEYDVIIVGAGPSGLSAAIKLKQMATENQSEISICIVEKGSEVGAHILSGNVIDPKALNELIPDWKETGAPLKTEVNKDSVRYLNENYNVVVHSGQQDDNTMKQAEEKRKQLRETKLAASA